MSAAQWRRAMNTQSPGARVSVVTQAPARAPSTTASYDSAASYSPESTSRWSRAWSHVRWRHVLVILALLLYPVVASPFFTYQIAAQSMALGLIALSLTFLGGYGGMVSLSQMTVAGVSGYLIAIFGTSSMGAISLGWPWWLAVVFSVLISMVFATLVGWLSVRTEGIHTIMITLAIGVAFFYLTQQNYALFNGFQGFSKISAPIVGEVDFTDPVAFYFLSVGCALVAYWTVKYLVRAPFGMALQGIRDNPRRMNSLGFNVTAHRLAAHAFAGLLASVGGILLIWYNNRISPGSINTGALINILVIAVLGGMKHPIGAFIGALAFVLLQNFAIDLVDRQRFNLVIGGVFLLIVFFSPDGLLGLWQKLRTRWSSASADPRVRESRRV
jgi:branched-chain amino acid transport system permease protein